MTPSRPLGAALAVAVLFSSLPRAHAQAIEGTTPPPPPPTVYTPPPPPIVYAPSPSYAPPPPYGYAVPQQLAYGPLYPLSLDGDAPGMRYQVLGPKGDDRVYASCTAPCRLELPLGSYRVQVDGESIPSKQQAIVLEGATRVYSQAGSKSAKNTGLVLAISGTSVAGIGLLVAMTASMTGGCAISECSSGSAAQKRRDEANATAGTALAIAGVGALLGTIGWITFAGNRTKMSVENGFGPRVSFGVAPTVGGASFALTGTF